MVSNRGYINVVAVIQKFFDQAISGNWSYNPQNYSENQIPSSVITQDFLNTYKYGWKTSYYLNTYDEKIDSMYLEDSKAEDIEKMLEELLSLQEDCDSCKI
jgi:ribonucleoside-diphosphate reductase alpha chain